MLSETQTTLFFSEVRVQGHARLQRDNLGRKAIKDAYRVRYSVALLALAMRKVLCAARPQQRRRQNALPLQVWCAESGLAGQAQQAGHCPRPTHRDSVKQENSFACLLALAAGSPY